MVDDIKVRVSNHAVNRFELRFTEIARASSNIKRTIAEMCRQGQFFRDYKDGLMNNQSKCAFVNGDFVAYARRIDYSNYLVTTVAKKYS